MLVQNWSRFNQIAFCDFVDFKQKVKYKNQLAHVEGVAFRFLDAGAIPATSTIKLQILIGFEVLTLFAYSKFYCLAVLFGKSRVILPDGS